MSAGARSAWQRRTRRVACARGARLRELAAGAQVTDFVYEQVEVHTDSGFAKP